MDARLCSSAPSDCLAALQVPSAATPTSTVDLVQLAGALRRMHPTLPLLSLPSVCAVLPSLSDAPPAPPRLLSLCLRLLPPLCATQPTATILLRTPSMAWIHCIMACAMLGGCSAPHGSSYIRRSAGLPRAGSPIPRSS